MDISKDITKNERAERCPANSQGFSIFPEFGMKGHVQYKQRDQEEITSGQLEENVQITDELFERDQRQLGEEEILRAGQDVERQPVRAVHLLRRQVRQHALPEYPDQKR